MKIDFLKDKKKYIIFSIILIVIIYGIYNNPDRRNNSVNSELQKLIVSSNSLMSSVTTLLQNNRDCFGDESLVNNRSAECITAISELRDTFIVTDKDNLSKLELFYKSKNLSLDKKTSLFIENNIKLAKSDSYSKLMNAYDTYFTNTIAWHKYFRDIVGIKGVDNMNSQEVMQAKYLAQNLVKSDEDLQLAKNNFTDYFQKNFDADFIQMYNNFSQKI